MFAFGRDLRGSLLTTGGSDRRRRVRVRAPGWGSGGSVLVKVAPVCGMRFCVADDEGEFGEQAAEGVAGLAARGLLGGGLALGGVRAFGAGDGVGGERRLFVDEEQLGPGFAEVPFEVVGEQAEEGVRADAVFATVVDRADLELGALEGAEGLLGVGELFVGADDVGRRERLGAEVGAQDVEAVERGLGRRSRPACGGTRSGRRRSRARNASSPCACRSPRRPRARSAPAPLSVPASTRCLIGASAASVACSSSSRLRARSLATSGLRQTTSRSPGVVVALISARFVSSKRPSCRRRP